MTDRCCDYRDHSPGPCACPEHEFSALHPFGTTPNKVVTVADMMAARWYPIVNDLIGGWSVATVDKPSGDHNIEAGDREIACFLDEAFARHIAELHNRQLPHREVRVGG